MAGVVCWRVAKGRRVSRLLVGQRLVVEVVACGRIGSIDVGKVRGSVAGMNFACNTVVAASCIVGFGIEVAEVVVGRVGEPV